MVKTPAARRPPAQADRHPAAEVIARLSASDLLSIIATTFTRVRSPWAVLLVRFKDDTDPSPALTTYQHLFTSAGTGSLNMVDFFSEMSHGKVDVSGSQVFGWYTLEANRADYVGNVYPQPAGKLNRDGLLDLARSTAAAAGVPLGDFAGVVVSGLGGVDLCGWVGGMAALCDSFSLSPSLLGQEMGHGYGLDHARFQGSADDYRDPWDVMSTASYPEMQAAHAEFGTVGPGLNAWNMRSREWLDESRVWAPGAGQVDVVVTLRPLHRTDLPGFLAAEVGPYLVEFRMNERWDAAIPRPCVLVHRFEDNHSYLMPAASGSQDLVVGDSFSAGDPNVQLVSPYYRVEVTAIDPNNRTATLGIRVKPIQVPPTPPGLVGQVLGGVAVDGGGWVIVGGKIVPVPPRGPIQALVQHLARYLEAGVHGDAVGPAIGTRRAALAGVLRATAALHASAEVVSEVPPGYGQR